MKIAPFSFLRSIGAMLVVIFVSACGGDGGGGGSDSAGQTSGGANARYGSLVLSGTGTNVAGTTFAALSRVGPTSQSQWYSVELSGTGLTYPSVVLAVAIDNINGTMVDFNYLISATQAAGEWVNFPVPPGTVEVTSTGITFTNLELTGYGTTTTTLILNGTLTF